VCVRAIVVPGCPVPDGHVVPPYGSSAEPSLPVHGPAGAAFAATASPVQSQPPLGRRLLVGLPLLALAKAVALSPMLGVLALLVAATPHPTGPDRVFARLLWFAQPARFPFYVLGKVVRGACWSGGFRSDGEGPGPQPCSSAGVGVCAVSAHLARSSVWGWLHCSQIARCFLSHHYPATSSSLWWPPSGGLTPALEQNWCACPFTSPRASS
jgi:hypothetical protein